MAHVITSTADAVRLSDLLVESRKIVSASTCGSRRTISRPASCGCTVWPIRRCALVERNIEEGRASGHALTFCSVLGQGACPISFPGRRSRCRGTLLRLLLEHTERHPIRLWNLWARAFQGHGDGKARRRRRRTGGAAQANSKLPARPGSCRASCFRSANSRRVLARPAKSSRGLRPSTRRWRAARPGTNSWYVAGAAAHQGRIAAAGQASIAQFRPPSMLLAKRLRLAKHQGALFWELRSAVSLARLRIGQDRKAEASQILAPVWALCEGPSDCRLREARALLDGLAGDQG